MATIKMKTDKPVAFDSPDHIQPWGTANDNSTNKAFNQKLFWWLPKQDISLLDIGCSGGGFVKSVLDIGCLAVGVEGSDYSYKHKRAEWATIPGNLFTADATTPFELTMHDEGKIEQIKFSVVTAWEFIEHIAEPDLEKVMSNISNHLAPNGVVIMSVSPNEEYINGVRLHQTVADKPWWVKKFDSLGFTNHDRVVEFFDKDWIRGEDNAPNSFHVVLTRKSEALPYAERMVPLAYLYPQFSAGVAYLTESFVKQGYFTGAPVVVVDVGNKGGFDSHWGTYGDQVELNGFAVQGMDGQRAPVTHSRKEVIHPFALSDREETVILYATGDSQDGLAVLPGNRELMSRFRQGGKSLAIKESPAQAMALDALVAAGRVSKPDFIKIDLKGAELKVLRGAANCLRESVLGVTVDLDMQAFRVGAPTLEQVQAMLMDFGFTLFDLKVEPWVRSIVVGHEGPLAWHGRGQVAKCKATFLRDMMPDLCDMSRKLSTEDKTRITRLASLAEVLGFADYSVELLVRSEMMAT